MPVQATTLFPSFVVAIAQVNSGLRDSNVAPSGMETEVYGIFVIHALFVSSTTGAGNAIPAAQAGATDNEDATVGASVDAIVVLGAVCEANN